MNRLRHIRSQWQLFCNYLFITLVALTIIKRYTETATAEKKRLINNGASVYLARDPDRNFINFIHSKDKKTVKNTTK